MNDSDNFENTISANIASTSKNGNYDGMTAQRTPSSARGKENKKFLKYSQEEVIEIRSLIKTFHLMTMTLTNTWGKKMKFGKKFDLRLKET